MEFVEVSLKHVAEAKDILDSLNIVIPIPVDSILKEVEKGFQEGGIDIKIDSDN